MLGGVASACALVIIRWLWEDDGLPASSPASSSPATDSLLPAPTSPPYTSPRWKEYSIHLSAFVTLLLLPLTSVNPLVSFTYKGAESFFMEGSHTRYVYYHQLGLDLFNDTPEYSYAVIDSFLYFAGMYFAPICTLFSCHAFVYLPHLISQRTSLRVLRTFTPLSMVSPLFIALLFAAPSMELFSTWIFDGTKLCEKGGVLYNGCLVITGKLEIGGWVMGAQAIATNWFVYQSINEYEQKMKIANA